MYSGSGNESLSKIKYNLLNPLPLLGLICAFYVLYNAPKLDGTETFFTIPLTFAICSFIFQDIIPYHQGGFGLKIFYLIVILKYLVLPIFTCYAGRFSGEWGYYTAGAYVYAILMQDIELIVCCATVKYFYGREYVKANRKIANKSTYYNDISFGGIAVIVLAVLIIAARGVSRLMGSMRFGLVTTALEAENQYGYDIWLGQTMLAFLVVVIVETFSRRKDNGKFLGSTIIPVTVVALSCLTIFGNNRTMIVYYAICGLMVLTMAFPEKKRLFYSIIIPVLILVIVSFTLLKQFHIDVSGTSTTLTASSNDVIGVQQYLTAYLCGTESIAKCFHLYGENGNQMQILTFLSDIINKTSILGLPGLNNIINVFRNIPTSYSLAMYWVEIVPVTGQTLFFGGYVFGPLLDIIAFFFVVRLLVKCEVKSKLSKSLSSVYIFTWLSGIFSFCMCRSMAVMYANCSYIPFYLWGAISVNKYIRKSRKKKVDVQNGYLTE